MSPIHDLIFLVTTNALDKNLQAVCDASLHFIYAGIGGPGATPDVTAFRMLTINEMVEHLPGP
jgi:hypothetical protein